MYGILYLKIVFLDAKALFHYSKYQYMTDCVMINVLPVFTRILYIDEYEYITVGVSYVKEFSHYGVSPSDKITHI